MVSIRDFVVAPELVPVCELVIAAVTDLKPLTETSGVSV